MTTSSERCGTTAGFARHQWKGEAPCPACKAAKAEYDKRWRAADRRTRLSRALAKAQGRAERDLARLHRADYVRLYEAHKSEILHELGLT